ncbi:MAG: ATP-binding protein, partial [Deltaproteobacteria bacterium]
MPEQARNSATRPELERLEGVRQVVAVSSCKGGVGKSTVAVNLALALAKAGHRTGLADVDFYGPSAQIMLGITEKPRPGRGDLIAPVHAHGIDVMSMGFFLDENAPVIWRGPMAMSATRQFLRGVEWRDLDVLVVDLPPGTGDIVLTLVQDVPVDGALVVTTPQDVALADVRRGIGMFERVNTPVLGLVENMSVFVCPDCGTRDELFGSRSGDQLCAELGISVLAELPLDERVCRSGDEGVPIVVAEPEHPASREFARLAEATIERLARGAAGRETEPEEMRCDEARGVLEVRWSDGVVTSYRLAGLRGWC